MTHFHGIGRWELNATRGALSLVVLCFLLPFFTYTLSSCGGTDASQTLEVTGIQLIRHEHGPVENRTDHAPPSGPSGRGAHSGRLGASERDRGGRACRTRTLGHADAAAGARRADRRCDGRSRVGVLPCWPDRSTSRAWTLATTRGSCFGLLLAAAATATAAVVPLSDRPLVADPGLGQARRVLDSARGLGARDALPRGRPRRDGRLLRRQRVRRRRPAAARDRGRRDRRLPGRDRGLAASGHGRPVGDRP